MRDRYDVLAIGAHPEDVEVFMARDEVAAVLLGGPVT